MAQTQEKGRIVKKLVSHKILITCVIGVFCFGLIVGYQWGKITTLKLATRLITGIHSVRENNQLYHFIFPLLLYSYGDAKQFLVDSELQNQMTGYINSQYKNGNATSVSVVYRQFPDGAWVGINDSASYHPGSLLKVLLMMAYFREAELDPNILQKNLLYASSTAAETDSLAFYLPSNLTVGQSYSIKSLMENMIENSDNGAQTLLIDNVDRNILNNAYIDLGVPSPDTTDGDYTLTNSQYAGFFRILYNSTYLEEEYSEQALEILSKSNYKDGISAGVPAGVPVAQKYGERVDSPDNKNVQAVELHNCGIVYAPKNPYELCIMTKGNDAGKLTAIIKNISALVYNHISGK